jgi:hypothetical protein
MFSVNSGALGAADGAFDMTVTFTDPPGAGSQPYTATVVGLVVLDQFGHATITFDQPTTQSFGSFSLELPGSPITISPGGTYELDGEIVTPEPRSVGLLGLGVASLLLFKKLHRKVVLRGF